MISERVQDILDETDPGRQLALSRRLRSEIWNALSDEERNRLVAIGLDLSVFEGAARRVK